MTKTRCWNCGGKGYVDRKDLPTACPNCGRPEPSRLNEERVWCGACGWLTDLYEAIKAGERKD